MDDKPYSSATTARDCYQPDFFPGHQLEVRLCIGGRVGENPHLNAYAFPAFLKVRSLPLAKPCALYIAIENGVDNPQSPVNYPG
jgi:hypothetical protein